MTSLTKLDYIKILDYYNVSVPKKKTDMKSTAEDILVNKLCRCIKKVSPKDEARGIGICTRSIFNKKGLVRGSFKCKKSSKKVTFKKRRNRETRKTSTSKTKRLGGRVVTLPRKSRKRNKK